MPPLSSYRFPVEVHVGLGEVVVRCGVWSALASVFLIALAGFWCGALYRRAVQDPDPDELDDDDDDDDDDDEGGGGRIAPGSLRPRAA